MEKEKYLKLISGTILISIIIGGIFLFIKRERLKQENIQLKEKVSQEKNLEDLLKNKYTSFFEEVPEDWKTYRNAKYGFELKYPDKIMKAKPAEPQETPLRGTTLYELEGNEGIFIGYFDEEGKKFLDIFMELYQGELSPEFLDSYWYGLYEEGMEMIHGFKIKPKQDEASFCTAALVYFSEEVPIYEILCSTLEKEGVYLINGDYFIPNKKEGIVFHLSLTLPFESSIFPYERMIQNDLAMVLWKKILSTFRFLR